MKKTVVFDFDGVIHSYKSGWKGDSVIPDPPVDGIEKALKEISEAGYEIVIVSARCASVVGKMAIQAWLDRYKLSKYVSRVCKAKPAAIVYIDDRAICFDGNASELLQKVEQFTPWTKKKDDEVDYKAVIHPKHYNIPNRKECIDEMCDIWGNQMTALWCEMTAYKYMYRMGLKDGNPKKQDEAKKNWYLAKAKQLENIATTPDKVPGDQPSQPTLQPASGPCSTPHRAVSKTVLNTNKEQIQAAKEIHAKNTQDAAEQIKEDLAKAISEAIGLNYGA